LHHGPKNDTLKHAKNAYFTANMHIFGFLGEINERERFLMKGTKSHVIANPSEKIVIKVVSA